MKETIALLPSLQDAAIEAAPSVELVINLLLLLRLWKAPLFPPSTSIFIYMLPKKH